MILIGDAKILMMYRQTWTALELHSDDYIQYYFGRDFLLLPISAVKCIILIVLIHLETGVKTT